MPQPLTALDKLSATDSLVVYRKNGAVARATIATLEDHIQLKISAPEDILIYDTSSYVEQSDATYIYFAWARLDGTGYKSERWDFNSGTAAGSTTGSGSIPADLTGLNYA